MMGKSGKIRHFGYFRHYAVCLGVIVLLMAGFCGMAAAEPLQDNIAEVTDNADIFTDDQEAALAKRTEKYSKKYNADIAIITIDDAHGKTAAAYADDYAEGLGMSMETSGHAGILYLIDMDNRKIWISTSGEAVGWYSESRLNKILDKAYEAVSDGDYADSGDAFLDGIYSYMGRAEGKSGRMTGLGVLLRLVASLAAGGVIVLGMVHNSGGKVTANAATYFEASDSGIVSRDDRFMNRTVTSRVIVKDKGKGGGSGGSSGGVHTSSSGGTHGGGGRSF